MPGNYPNDPDSVLRGLFGSLVSAAEQNLSTADVWSNLRSAANDWARGVLSVTAGSNVTEQQIAETAQGLIGHVTILDVNRYRALAGQAVRAKQALQAFGPNDQIDARGIFVAPWNTTADNPAVPTRYRLRVQRSITVHGFTDIVREEWASYDLGISVTSVSDALARANSAFNTADYNRTADINEILDYSLEAV